MATVERVRSERRFVLRGVSWQTYSALREAPGNDNVRMTYDRGEMELMSPSPFHEQSGYLLGRLVDEWTVARGIAVKSCRSMTVRREDLDRGFEPDNSYYIAHEPDVRHKTDLDFSIDPPPDLTVEIEFTRSAVNKMTICALFGVPEVWVFDGADLRVMILSGSGRYVRRPRSAALPGFPLDRARDLLRQIGSAGETDLVRSFREWLESRGGSGDS